MGWILASAVQVAFGYSLIYLMFLVIHSFHFVYPDFSEREWKNPLTMLSGTDLEVAVLTGT